MLSVRRQGKIAGNSDSPLTKDEEAAIQEFYGADPDAGLAREALSLYRSEAATDGADGSRGIEFMTDKHLRCGPTLIAALPESDFCAAPAERSPAKTIREKSAAILNCGAMKADLEKICAFNKWTRMPDLLFIFSPSNCAQSRIGPRSLFAAFLSVNFYG